MQVFQNISYLDLGEGEVVEALASSFWVCRVVGRGWSSQEEIEKCLLKFSTIVDLSVVTVFPSLSAVGS